MLNLSFKLNTFKRQIKRHISLLKMFRKIITIIIEKQSSLATRKKNSSTNNWTIILILLISFHKFHRYDTLCDKTAKKNAFWHDLLCRWIDKIVTFKNMKFFNAINFRWRVLHFWKRINYFKRHFKHRRWNFFFQIRVIFINRDHRFQAYTSKKIVIIIQSMINWQHFYFQDIEHVRNDHEMIIIENVNYEISFDVLFRRSNVYLNRDYDDENDEKTFIDAEIYIRRIYHFKSKILRLICRLHFIKKNWKLIISIENILKFFSLFSFSLYRIFFIDVFDIHRNMYQFLKFFYLIFANFFYEERRKLTIVFILIFDFHDAILNNVVKKIVNSFKSSIEIFISKSMKKWSKCVHMLWLWSMTCRNKLKTKIFTL